MVNKLGQINWLQQSVFPVGGKNGAKVGASQYSEQSQPRGVGGDDLMARLNALDNLELKPKTDSKFDIMA